MTDQEQKLQSDVDDDFIGRAEEDIYRILLQQRRQFNQRWQNHPTMNKVKVFLRYFGLLLCVVGVVLCAGSLFLGMSWDHRVWPLWALLVLFLLLAWFFINIPKFEQRAQQWTERVSQKSCRKLAKKCVKQADGMVPFKAQYEIKGDLISYYRKQPGDEASSDHWQFVWNRTMAGYAVHSNHATVFFKTEKSIQPKIIVLHKDVRELQAVLSSLNIKSSHCTENETP